MSVLSGWWGDDKEIVQKMDDVREPVVVVRIQHRVSESESKILGLLLQPKVRRTEK